MILGRMHIGNCSFQIGASGSGGGGSTPSEHPETRFTLQDGTVETYNITGTLDRQWFIDNGYFLDVVFAWEKIIIQVDIGNTVSGIGWTAFQGCSNLTSVTIPTSVTIGEDAFYNCSGLTSVTITGNDIEDANFVKQQMIDAGVPSNITWNMPNPTPIDPSQTRFTLQDKTVETYNITGALDLQWLSANGFYDNAISWAKTIIKIKIGNTVTSIQSYTFAGCTSLRSISIPDTVTSIGEYAFDYCPSLTRVTITANGGNAENVKQLLISARVSSSITWNMPS